MYLLRLVASQVEAGTTKVISGNILKGAGLLPPEEELRNRGDGAIALGRGEQELNHAIRVRVGKRLKQYRIYDSEDGGVDADAERQGSDCGESKSRVGAEHAQCMFEVVPEIAHEPAPFANRMCQPEAPC